MGKAILDIIVNEKLFSLLGPMEEDIKNKFYHIPAKEL